MIISLYKQSFYGGLLPLNTGLNEKVIIIKYITVQTGGLYMTMVTFAGFTTYTGGLYMQGWSELVSIADVTI